MKVVHAGGLGMLMLMATAGTHAWADWQYTRWGMTPKEVVKMRLMTPQSPSQKNRNG